VQLVDTLRSSGLNIEDAEIIAQTGWTTAELKQAIASEDPQGPFEMVSLLIGVNNQYRHLDTGLYRIELRELMETAIQLADNDTERVIIVSIPDYGVTPFAQNMDPDRIAKEIDDYNAIKSEESARLGLPFIDVTPISRMAASDPDLLAEDKLHPSGKMYKEWVKLIFPVAKEILSNR
jgi:lysophospholipase L1-like esterase